MTTARSGERKISVVLPVYNEAGNIAACLRGLYAALKNEPHEILICYDFDADNTLPAIEAMPDRPPTVRFVKNDLGRGVAFAVRAGFQAAAGDVIVTTMADLSDPPEVIPAMAAKIREEGAHVVAGSRYMKGGSQTGGPLLKRTLSCWAGLSLHFLAGVRTKDATTNFRAYSAEFLRQTPVESKAGFEVALELTAKAHLRGFKIAELPSSWRDRSAGESRFRLWKWLPRYLYWYGMVLAVPVFVFGVWALTTADALSFVHTYGVNVPYWDEWELVPKTTGNEPVTLAWLWAQHNEHRIAVPKLLYLGLAKVTAGDSRAGMYFNVAALAAAALLLIFAVRRRRGRIVWADAFFPLLLLNLGHWSNFLWAFQIAFASTAVLFCATTALIVTAGEKPTWRTAVGAGTSLVALTTCGACGLALVPALALWLLFAGVARLRAKDKGARRDGAALLSAAAAALTAVGLYFVGYQSVAFHPAVPEAVGRGTARFLAAGVGPMGAADWPWSGFGIIGLAVFSTGLAGWTLFFRKDKRVTAFGLLACAAAVTALALGVGYGRAGLGEGFCSSPRYTTLAAPLLAVVYLIWECCAAPAFSRFVQVCLFAILCTMITYNARLGHLQGLERRTRLTAFLTDLRAGMSDEEAARRHADVYPTPRLTVERTRMLRAARLGPFKNPSSKK